MRNSRNIWLHIVLLLAVVTLTVSVQAALEYRHIEEHKALSKKAAQTRTQELSASWNALTYVEAGDQSVSRLLARIDWPTNGLTTMQLAKLKPRLAKTLAYLQSPELITYGWLKTNGLHWKFSLSSRVTNDYGAAIGEARQADEVVERLWQAMTPPTTAQRRPYLAAVCLDMLILATSKTNSGSALVNGPARKGLTALRMAPEPGFSYAPKHTVSEGGGPDELYAHFSFYARSNTSTNAGPVYLSLAWSEPDQEWVLGRLMSDVLLKFEVLF